MLTFGPLPAPCTPRSGTDTVAKGMIPLRYRKTQLSKSRRVVRQKPWTGALAYPLGSMPPKLDYKEATRRRNLMDALYRKYHRALQAFLGRRSLNKDEVADIVQETYCRIQQAVNVDEIRNPRAFLFRVARNVWLNTRKLRCNAMERARPNLETLEIAGDDPGPYRSVMAEQELALVRAALEELSPTCREVFVMNRFENMTYPQIASALELSVSMIEKHVSYAIAHMRKRLEHGYGPRAPSSLMSQRRDVGSP